MCIPYFSKSIYELGGGDYVKSPEYYSVCLLVTGVPVLLFCLQNICPQQATYCDHEFHNSHSLLKRTFYPLVFERAGVLT